MSKRISRKLSKGRLNPIDDMDLLSKNPFEDDYKEPETWTLITALDRVLDQAKDSELKEEFWESCKNPINFLTEQLGLSKIQVVFLAIMVEAGEPMSWRKFGNYLECSRLSMMVYSEELEDLVAKRWLVRRGTREMGGCYEGFALVQGVATALRHNKPFVPEKIDGLTEQEFIDKLESHIDKNLHDRNVDFKDDEEWMLNLCKANPHLPLCHDILTLDDIHEQSLMLSYLQEDIALKTLSVPSVTGWEQMMRDFLITFADEHEMEHEVDGTGNVYLTKGNVRDGEYYPCVCAHMDTVQSVQRKWITENKLLEIKTEEIDGQHQYYCENFGLGADDKAGIAICLSLFISEPRLKGAFFVMEEAGCLGSEEANLSWFRDVGYIIAYDSPGKEVSWACGGARLFDREFYEKYLADLVDEFKIKKFCNHPYTDIMMLRRNTSLACMNVFAGYYHYHTNYESCIAEEMDDAVKLGKTLINRLGYSEYLIPYVDRMHDDHNEDDEFFFEKFGRYW